MKRWILIILLAVIAAGCIKPVQQLGCCMRDNATDATNPGCVLYNTTTFLPTNKYFNPCGGSGMDCTVMCNETAGNCNVSFKIYNASALNYDREYHLIPICTEDQIQQCVDPNCTAMVCGDFKFKPRAAPGFQTTDNSAGDIPPDEEDGAALNFYNAQCRFLPMDAKLRQIMKNSKSSINVFRIGVGGSFDEFDQYRYYFPMSDKFCNVNPPTLPGDKRIDRYMNYIQWDSVAGMATSYDPEDIEDNCFDQGNVPGPFNFAEVSAVKSSTIMGVPVSYTTVVPDATNYKFAHYGRLDYWATFVDANGGYYRYTTQLFTPANIFKKIDEGYYRRELSKVHADTIYDTAGTGQTRAAFECDISSSECYSGNCDTRVYQRGVLLEAGISTNVDEVVADCNTAPDATGKTFVYCAPTKSVTISAGQVPSRGYATVDIIPARIESAFNYQVSFETLAQDEAVLDGLWDGFETIASVVMTGSLRTDITYAPNRLFFYYTYRKYCSHDYAVTEDNQDDWVMCSYVEGSQYPPPVGGIHFFGLLGDDEVLYNGKTVIGYTLAASDEVDDLYAVKNCNMVAGTDYQTITLSSLSDSDLDALRTAFKPYFRKRLAEIKAPGFSDGCGSALNPLDAVISAMPWVVSYEKGIHDDGFFDENYNMISTHINNVPAQEIRSRNIYDEAMQLTAGTSSCELRRTTIWWDWWTDTNYYYDLALSKYITLFYYDGSSAKIGDCSIDDVTYQPEVKTYGWCEPCTTSTLAFQTLAAYDRVYMPGYTAKIEGATGTENEMICRSDYDARWEGFMNFQVSDNVSCYNPKITDINDYKESIGAIGSPRTVPEASILKERLGNYMKSGIMPVFDLSDDSNWVIDNPDAEADTQILWWTIEHGSADYFAEYDFERTFGQMGASVVIVETVTSAADAQAKAQTIFDRSQIVRENCFGCMAAFHVENPSDNETFKDIILPIMSQPTGEFNIEMITMSYEVSTHSGLTNATQVADDLETYGRTSLRTPGPGRGKPVMIVGFNVDSNDGTWSDSNYDELFTEIVLRQDELINSGLVGIIYSPARGGIGSGAVVNTWSGVGYKDQKFCALQGAMQRMSESPPTALFTKVLVADNATCVKCSSIDLVLGDCNMECDNGVECLLPSGVPSSDSDEYRCPVNTVVEPCTLCKDIPGTFTCEMRYTNGTDSTITGNMADLQSDLYLDIIGAFEKPERCCIQNIAGQNYSYYKTAFGTSINKPVVFPRSGDPNTDCGVGDPSKVGQLTSFCNQDNIPLKEYDITCEID
jgi:hypothetical protein